MKAGFYDAVFTPPVGSIQAGDYFPYYFNGVAGELKVRAAVLETEEKRVAIACVDCCTLGKPVIDRAMEYLAGISDMKLDGYIISASHTHSGSSVSPFVQTEMIPRMSTEVQKLVGIGVTPDPIFSEWVARQIATAIFMAAQKAEPALINTGKGEESGFMFNRRLICKDGRAYSHPGKMNPDIVEPAGPIDPMVGVVGAWREDGSLIGAIINFCCHGTTYSGHMVHGDWLAYTEETIKKLFGENTGVVTLNGPCGDVTQVDNRSLAKSFGLDIAKRLGFRVAAEAAKVLMGAEKQPDPTLACLSKTIYIKHRVPTAESLEKAWKTVEEYKDNVKAAPAIFARERIIAGELAKIQLERNVELAAIQIGDAILLSTPAEYFTSLSLRIKESTAFDNTFTVELANDCVGYVPDKAAFDPKHGGGYETVLTAYSNLCPDAGDIIADTLIDMSKAFVPDKTPVDESQPRGVYWSYGALGPDLD